MIIIGQVSDQQKLEQFFEAGFEGIEELYANWNIYPDKGTLALLSERPNTFKQVIYGMVPFWSKSKKVFHEAPVDGDGHYEQGSPLKLRFINNPAFRVPIHEKRCVIPADYFISIEGENAYLFFNQNRTPMALAGIYDCWKQNMKDKYPYYGFSVLTFPSYGVFSRLGIRRAPFILEQEYLLNWRDSSLHFANVTQLINFYDDSKLNGYPVNPLKVKIRLNEQKITMPTGDMLKPLEKKKSGSVMSRVIRNQFHSKSSSAAHSDMKNDVWSKLAQ